VHAEFKVLLTGTPMQNNLTELWALLHFLFPELFESSVAFDNAFNLASGTKSVVDNDVLRKAHSVLSLLMLRRTKATVEKGVPPKCEITLPCPLSPTQVFWYKALLAKDSKLLDRVTQTVDEKAAGRENAGKKVGDFAMLKNLCMQLRKNCNHPYLFKDGEPDPANTTTKELVQASGKLALLDRLLIKLKKAGHRVCIFSQFTKTLDILDDYMNDRGWRYTRLDGSTNRVHRYVNINSFNADDSRLFCFLMSTRAGGMGINLQTADTVVLFDSDWNPQQDLQAMARVHRIGQTKVVHVYRLISSGTIEERILERAQKKLYLDAMVNTGHGALLPSSQHPLATSGCYGHCRTPAAWTEGTTKKQMTLTALTMNSATMLMTSHNTVGTAKKQMTLTVLALKLCFPC
jgi:SWI/SNF-related matrix-associated actin-dependent regulator of chromatin subfamily A member 5